MFCLAMSRSWLALKPSIARNPRKPSTHTISATTEQDIIVSSRCDRRTVALRTGGAASISGSGSGISLLKGASNRRTMHAASAAPIPVLPAWHPGVPRWGRLEQRHPGLALGFDHLAPRRADVGHECLTRGLVRVAFQPQDVGGMERRGRVAREARFEPLAALLHQPESAANDRVGRGRSQAQDDVGLHDVDRLLQPRRAGGGLLGRWRAVAQPARIQHAGSAPDHVADKNVLAEDAVLTEALVQQRAGPADEWAPRRILVLARPFADEHQGRFRVALAEDYRIARRSQSAGRAAGGVRRKGRESLGGRRSVRGEYGLLCDRRGLQRPSRLLRTPNRPIVNHLGNTRPSARAAGLLSKYVAMARRRFQTCFVPWGESGGRPPAHKKANPKCG